MDASMLPKKMHLKRNRSKKNLLLNALPVLVRDAICLLTPSKDTDSAAVAATKAMAMEKMRKRCPGKETG